MICGLPALLLFFVQTSGIVHRPGIDLPYVTQGEGRPVLLLSGGPGFTSDYVRGVMDGCKTKGLRWILLEQRGTPRARMDRGTAKEFTIDEYVKDLEALREQLHLKKWNVIGHSWGSMLAHAYLAAHPDHVSSIVFLGNTGPDTTMLEPAGDNIDRFLTPAERAEEAKAGANAVNGPAEDGAALKLFMLQAPAYFFSRETFEKNLGLFPEGCLVGNTENLVFPQVVGKWDVSKAISRYKGPVLALQGRQDILGETPVWKDKMAMPQTQVSFVERAGHMTWLDSPKPFFDLLDAFLAANAK